MIHRWVDFRLKRAKLRFAPAYYELHRQRVTSALRSQCGCLGFAALIALLFVLPYWFFNGSVLLASIGGSILALAVVGSTFAACDMFRARVIPYFEHELSGTNTWLAGRDLLWNSLALDETAQQLGVTPLSAFLSGDPLIVGEPVDMFHPEDALVTVNALLGSTQITSLAVSDLKKLQCALTIASENGAMFSLHLREGTSASGHEMEMRKGSYF